MLTSHDWQCWHSGGCDSVLLTLYTLKDCLAANKPHIPHNCHSSMWFLQTFDVKILKKKKFFITTKSFCLENWRLNELKFDWNALSFSVFLLVISIVTEYMLDVTHVFSWLMVWYKEVWMYAVGGWRIMTVMCWIVSESHRAEGLEDGSRRLFLTDLATQNTFEIQRACAVCVQVYMWETF